MQLLTIVHYTITNLAVPQTYPMKVHIRRKKLSGGGHSYFLDYHHNGERIKEYLKVHIRPGESAKDKKLLMENIRAQRELELATESYGVVPKHKKNIDFFFFFERFIKNTTRKDPRIFVASLSYLKKFTGKNTLPSSLINDKFCRDFRSYLTKYLHGETPFNYFNAFRRVISDAVRERIFLMNPARDVVNYRPSNKILGKEVLNDQELRLLFSTHCGNDEVKRAFLFCCFTGLRAVDVRELRWKNIDVKNKMFRFNQAKTGVRMYPPLNSTALSLLGEEGSANDFVFSLKTQAGVNKSLKNWVKAAGIKKHITFHCARHSFATSLLVHGSDLKTTSELLGHTTTRETEKYTHISEKMKRKAVDSLPELI